MPGKDSAVCSYGVWERFVHEEVAQVDPMAHPLVRDAAGEFFVKAEFEIELRIERTRWLCHKPNGPIRVVLADFLNFGAPTPARAMIVPFDFVLGDVAERASLDEIAGGDLVRLAAMLGADLDDLLALQGGVTSGFYFGQDVAHGLFAIDVFASIDGHF